MNENQHEYRDETACVLSMSRVTKKPVFGDSADSAGMHKPGCHSVLSLKMAIYRGLKFRIYDCTIYVAKTKALISFAVTAKLICVFVFAYAVFSFRGSYYFIMIIKQIVRHRIGNIWY